MKTAIHRRGFYSKILGGCFNDCKLSNEAFPSVRGEFESNGEWYHNCVNILKLLVSWSYFLMNFQQIQGDTKKTGTLKNPTKIEEIQEKKFIDRN